MDSGGESAYGSLERGFAQGAVVVRHAPGASADASCLLLHELCPAALNLWRVRPAGVYRQSGVIEVAPAWRSEVPSDADVRPAAVYWEPAFVQLIDFNR